mmetsp:Transcript_935/g.1672  ORF Transcript_935/g.1672 Transcript_935/m.1672 type:complete len:305 (+) Transcript_935:303-1217(+)
MPKLVISRIKKQGQDLPKEIWLVIAMFSIGHSTIHSFYPNMSKFLQQNFGLTNAHAGHLSSIPYIFSSIAVPLFGHMLSCFGEHSYEYFLTFSAFSVFMSQVLFLCIQQWYYGSVFNSAMEPQLNGIMASSKGEDLFEVSQLIVAVPILLIGIGHTMQATIQGPIVNKYIDSQNKDEITQIFSILKIFEGLVLSITMYANGHIRQITGTYFGVSLLIIVVSALGQFVGFNLIQLSSSNFIKGPNGELIRRGSPNKNLELSKQDKYENDEESGSSRCEDTTDTGSVSRVDSKNANFEEIGAPFED